VAARLLLALIALLALPAHADGEREQAVQLTVEGIEGELLANVQALLALEQDAQAPALDRAGLEQRVAAAEDEIRLALQPFGYYSPVIRAAVQAAAGEPWTAALHIEPGPVTTIASVELALSGAGASDPALQAVVADPGLQRGAVFDHRDYEQAKQRLLRDAGRLGYIAAHYRVHRVEVDPHSHSADIRLELDSGAAHVFGEVRFEQDTFSEAYLERYLLITPGMRFDRELLSQQRKALSGSGHFLEVAVEAGEPTAGAQPAIPVNIRLRPFKPNRFRGRAGWGTETGAGIQLDWSRRYIGSQGHRFNLGVIAVEERERLAGDLRYWIPLDPLSGSRLELLMRHESKDLNFRDVDLDEGGDTRIENNLVSATLQWPERRIGGFDATFSTGINLSTESYDVFQVLFGNLPGSAQETIAGIIGDESLNTLAPDFRALIGELRSSLRRTDGELFIRRGDYLGLRLLFADEALGSNISFWQARLSHWSIWPVAGRGRLLFRNEIGYSEAESREVLGATFNQMPELYEFRGGGARNVRGYGFETLFPENGITGGRHQLVNSLEYEHELITDVSAAVFLDAGNAFNDWGNIEPKLGAGFGLRWRSPLGPARIDIGFPLDDADSAFQLYLSVGPEF